MACHPNSANSRQGRLVCPVLLCTWRLVRLLRLTCAHCVWRCDLTVWPSFAYASIAFALELEHFFLSSGYCCSTSKITLGVCCIVCSFGGKCHRTRHKCAEEQEREGKRAKNRREQWERVSALAWGRTKNLSPVVPCFLSPSPSLCPSPLTCALRAKTSGRLFPRDLSLLPAKDDRRWERERKKLCVPFVRAF